MTHPLIFCVFGIHDYIFKEAKTAGGVAVVGGYIFLPSTKRIYRHACCHKETFEVVNYKGEVIS